LEPRPKHFPASLCFPPGPRTQRDFIAQPFEACREFNFSPAKPTPRRETSTAMVFHPSAAPGLSIDRN
jgi:hypothetical protein